MITVSSTSSGITFDAAADASKGGSWLTISPSGGGCCTTPKVITVMVDGTQLTAGTYVGQLTFTQYVTHDRVMTVTGNCHGESIATRILFGPIRVFAARATESIPTLSSAFCPNAY